MLSSTFIHLPGVGPATEQELWRSGVTTWEEFLNAEEVPARIRSRQAELAQAIDDCVTRLGKGSAAYFDRCLPARERWRMYADFRHNAAFLDIETTGLSPDRSVITLVGVLDSDGYTAYLRDENLDDLREALERYDLVVTFNGASFDLPYIEHFFGRVFRNMAHIDLRVPLRRLGLTGGLKAIESQTGLGRPSVLSSLNGYDAVRLWRMWQRGSSGARDTLVRYNAEDVASLPALADLAYNSLSNHLALDRDLISPSALPAVDHIPFDVDIVAGLMESRFASQQRW